MGPCGEAVCWIREDFGLIQQVFSYALIFGCWWELRCCFINSCVVASHPKLRADLVNDLVNDIILGLVESLGIQEVLFVSVFGSHP